MNVFILDFGLRVTYLAGSGPPVGLSKRGLQALSEMQNSPPDQRLRVLPAKKRRDRLCRLHGFIGSSRRKAPCCERRKLLVFIMILLVWCCMEGVGVGRVDREEGLLTGV